MLGVHISAVSSEAKRGHCIPWGWSYRRCQPPCLPSARAASALTAALSLFQPPCLTLLWSSSYCLQTKNLNLGPSSTMSCGQTQCGLLLDLRDSHVSCLWASVFSSVLLRGCDPVTTPKWGENNRDDANLGQTLPASQLYVFNAGGATVTGGKQTLSLDSEAWALMA